MKISLVCIAKNEQNYIEEWIYYHLKLGFDHIFIFKNDWEYKSLNKNVTVIDFPGQSKQIEAYNSFIQNYVGKYDWAAFFDVDEFLVLKNHSNIKEFVADYSIYDSIAINWIIFGSNNFDTVTENNYSVLERFTRRDSKVFSHIKTINKLSTDIYFQTPHNTNKSWISPEGIIGSGPFNEIGSDNIAQLNHYFCKSKSEFLEKISRGRADMLKFRNIDEFYYHDMNDVEDLNALNFLKK